MSFTNLYVTNFLTSSCITNLYITNGTTWYVTNDIPQVVNIYKTNIVQIEYKTNTVEAVQWPKLPTIKRPSTEGWLMMQLVGVLLFLLVCYVTSPKPKKEFKSTYFNW